MADAIFEHLRKRGHEAEWWSWYLKRPAYESLPGAYCFSQEPPQSVVDYARILAKYVVRLREFRPDVVFAFTHYANTLGLAAGRLIGVPVRIAHQGSPRDSYPFVCRTADSLLGTLGVYSANVMCSRAVLQSFSNHSRSYHADVRVILNGSKQRAIPLTSDDRRAAKEALGIHPTAKVVVAVGRLSEEKRHHILIDSMKNISQGCLLIAGDGAARPELEAKVVASSLENRVRLLGNISPKEVGRLLAAADVFAMPSKFEGLSLALVEAMAAGLPIVASDIPPIRDVVVDENGRSAGVLLESTNSKDWADAILNVLGNTEVAESFSQSGLIRARAFDIDRSAVEYVEIAECQLRAAEPQLQAS